MKPFSAGGSADMAEPCGNAKKPLQPGGLQHDHHHHHKIIIIIIVTLIMVMIIYTTIMMIIITTMVMMMSRNTITNIMITIKALPGTYLELLSAVSHPTPTSSPETSDVRLKGQVIIIMMRIIPMMRMSHAE